MSYSNMEGSGSRSVSRTRRSSSRTNGRYSGSYSGSYIGSPLYRRDSNLSTASFMDDVEMAHDEVCILYTCATQHSLIFLPGLCWTDV
jgi:hypothetical protein